jgi:alcohol dehydrogenase
MTNTMKAMVATGYGSPEVLQLQEVKKPQPNKNEVLIKIHATSVTASDVLIRGLKAPLIYKLIVQLAFGFGKPRNPILGMVVAGTIAGKGKKSLSLT